MCIGMQLAVVITNVGCKFFATCDCEYARSRYGIGVAGRTHPIARAHDRPIGAAAYVESILFRAVGNTRVARGVVMLKRPVERVSLGRYLAHVDASVIQAVAVEMIHLHRRVFRKAKKKAVHAH